MREYYTDLKAKSAGTLNIGTFPCAYCGRPTDGAKVSKGIEYSFCKISHFRAFKKECYFQGMDNDQITKLLRIYRSEIIPEWICTNGDSNNLPLRRRTIKHAQECFSQSNPLDEKGVPSRWFEFLYAVNGTCPAPPEGFLFTHPLFSYLNEEFNLIPSCQLAGNGSRHDVNLR